MSNLTPYSPQPANPTASLGLTAINGTLDTYMRSDGAPALSQSITPTWTGLHTFNPSAVGNIGIQINAFSSSTTANLLNLSGYGSAKMLQIDASRYTFSTRFDGESMTIVNGFTGGAWARDLMKFTNAAEATQYYSLGALGTGQTFTYGYIHDTSSNNIISFGETIDLSTRSGGSIPIGTITIGTPSTTVSSSLVVLTPSVNTNSVSAFEVNGAYDSTSKVSLIKIWGHGVLSGGGYTGNLAFITNNGAAENEKMRLTGAGNLGIGCFSPTNVLSLGSGANRKIWIERRSTTNSAGRDLTIAAGGSTGTMVATVDMTGAAAGSGYTVGDVLTLVNTTALSFDGVAATVTVATIDGSGGITGITLTTKGSEYTTGVKTTTGGTGTAGTVNIATLESATNGAGGNLVLTSGVSSGTGTSQIQFWTSPAGASSATDNTLTQRLTIDGAGDITIAEGGDLILGTTTGTKIGTATTQKLGFFNATPVVQPTAYTQTYSTASKTVPAATASNPPAGGTGATAGAYDTAVNRDAMITSLTNNIADVLALKKVVNSLIDDLQALGLVA